MFKLFAIITALVTGNVNMLVHQDEFPTKEACEQQAAESKPMIVLHMASSYGAIIDTDYTLTFECKAEEKGA